MINRALNQKTGRHLGYEALLDLARISAVSASSLVMISHDRFLMAYPHIYRVLWLEKEACGCWASVRFTRSTTGQTSGPRPFRHSSISFNLRFY